MKSILFILIVSMIASVQVYAQSSATVQKADSLFFLSDWKNAVPAYEAALQIAATNSLAWNRLGFSYQNLGQYEKALSNYTKALENKPAPGLEATIQSRVSRIYSLRKDTEKAFTHLQKAVTVGYVNLTELETHKDFDNLRKDARFAEVVRTVRNNAFPCMAMAQAREFDFWVGEWDVYPNGATVIVGHSKVEVASGGCMILENWTALGSAPNTGKSMNYVNAATGKWEQFWLGSGGLTVTNPQKFINGEYKDGAMRFDFETLTPQNQKQIGRFIFFNMGPDQVRQFNEVSSDDGKTWTTTYDFIYKRKKG